MGPVLLGAALGGCVTNPTTGHRSLNLISRDDEIAIGMQQGPQFVQENGGEVQDAQLRQYVTDLGMKLKANVETDEQRNLPWTFTLLNSPEINAFALPGGKVNISLALAQKLTSEAQMAGVLGHEIGHVTARHANANMNSQLGVGIATKILGAVVDDPAAGQLIEMGGQTVVLKYGRGQESEADALGMRYMTRAGYTPEGMKGVMQVLADISKGDRQPEIFSTHPYPENRLKDIEKSLAGDYAAVVKDPKYVTNADRYRSLFLARAQSLKPVDIKTFQQNKQQQLKARLRGMIPTGDGERQLAGDDSGRVFDLSRPASWCGVCAARAIADAE